MTGAPTDKREPTWDEVSRAAQGLPPRIGDPTRDELAQALLRRLRAEGVAAAREQEDCAVDVRTPAVRDLDAAWADLRAVGYTETHRALIEKSVRAVLAATVVPITMAADRLAELWRGSLVYGAGTAEPRGQMWKVVGGLIDELEAIYAHAAAIRTERDAAIERAATTERENEGLSDANDILRGDCGDGKHGPWCREWDAMKARATRAESALSAWREVGLASEQMFAQITNGQPVPVATRDWFRATIAEAKKAVAPPKTTVEES